MTSVVWDTSAFPVGSTLLERIESLADEFEGAVLLVTPDVQSVRSGRSTNEPVSNVMFEYGYLSARLTRRRVAICLFEDAALPSDLQGVKIINSGAVDYRAAGVRGVGHRTLELPTRMIGELRSWLEGLPRSAERIPSVIQLHRYSGTWEIETRFKTWRGMQVTDPNEIFWFGSTSLFIPPSGRGGKGVMYGSNHVHWAGYQSRHDVVNDVREATVDECGVLSLRVLILRRHLVSESGQLPDERFNAELPEKDFDIHLEPVAGQPRELRGVHEYTRGIETYQEAVERYRRIE
jgi:hypothetical protein